MKEQEQIIMARDGDGLRGSPSSSEKDGSSRAAGSSRRSTSRTQDIDRHVGARIRERRINRVSAGRLFEVAQVLSVPVSYFFDGLEKEGERGISPRERMCLELARNFAQIPNERHQEALSQ